MHVQVCPFLYLQQQGLADQHRLADLHVQVCLLHYLHRHGYGRWAIGQIGCKGSKTSGSALRPAGSSPERLCVSCLSAPALTKALDKQDIWTYGVLHPGCMHINKALSSACMSWARLLLCKYVARSCAIPILLCRNFLHVCLFAALFTQCTSLRM